MTSIGLVVVHAGRVRREKTILKRITDGVALTPSGRVLAVTYNVSNRWEPSMSIEGIATRTILDPAGRRGDLDDWEFAGNLAVRVCEVKADERRITSEVGVILFRRSGDKPYVRRHSIPADQIDSSRLNTLHPVFTRDIANNVWHFEKRDHMSAITKRLGALLAWPDEKIAVIGSGTTTIDVGHIQFDDDLIGVPTKIDYPWALPVLDFGATD